MRYFLKTVLCYNYFFLFLKIKLFVYFITFQLFQHEMYNVALSQTLQKIHDTKVLEEKGNKVYNGYLKVEGCVKLFLNKVLSNKNFTVCIHLLPLSSLLFILLGLFSFFIMQSFSDKQRSQ